MSHIIYAEDDKLMAAVVRNMMRTAGHVVGVIEDGNDALSAIKAKRPQLVMLDCSLPNLSGIDILREIRLNQSMFEMPVLMVTGRLSPSDVQLAAYAGADGYVKKPFDPEYLIYMVNSLIDDGRAAGHMAH